MALPHDEESRPMPNNRISPEIIAAVYAPQITHVLQRGSLFTRFIARLRADRFDMLLAVGVPVPDGGALAAHAARLMSAREREAIAHSLHRALDAARRGNDLTSGRIPVEPANVLAAE